MLAYSTLRHVVILGALILVLTHARPVKAQGNGASRPTNNLAVGGSFEHWSDGIARKWVLYGNGKANQTVDARRGHFAVRLVGDSERTNVTLQYVVRLPEGIDGKTLRISILAKTSERRSAAFNLHWNFGGREERATKTHPGDGEWSRLTHILDLPPNTNSSLLQIRCVLVLRRPAETPAVFDDMIIEIVDTKRT